MQKTELLFEYPEDLIATSPERPTRVLLSDKKEVREITKAQLLQMANPGDLWVINETQVLPRRVFTEKGLEILFLAEIEPLVWQVLFVTKDYKIGDQIDLPGGQQMTLLEKGRPQKVKVSSHLEHSYFIKNGEVPLPPYIQKARKKRHQENEDLNWYQTEWAKRPGSLAAPTASLHFTNEDLNELKQRKIAVEKITLHVGLGTFLPVTTEHLKDHVMHAEQVFISNEVWNKIEQTKKNGHRVWALGTTVTRSLESAALGLIAKNEEGFCGETRLMILPGFEFKVVDVLMTNFHQPESTLLALVAAFSGLDHVKACYRLAIERKFRLFSYGDLSVWIN